VYIEAKISTPFFLKKNGISMMNAIYSNRKTALNPYNPFYGEG